MMKATRTISALVLVMASFGCDRDEIDHPPAESDGGEETEAPVGELEANYPSLAATAYCEALFACDLALCESDVDYATVDECIAAEQALLAEAQTSAQAAGLTFDEACVQSVLATYAEVGCIGFNASERGDYGLSFWHWQCPAYHGSIAVGEGPCLEIVGTNYAQCGAQQKCQDETCISMPVCECGEGSTCLEFEPGTTCLPDLTLGEPCTSDVGASSCSPATYCGWDPDAEISACVPRLELGAACSWYDECQSGECVDDVCVPAYPLLCSPQAAPRHWR